MFKSKDHLSELKKAKALENNEEKSKIIQVYKIILQSQIALEDVLSQYKTIQYESVELLYSYVSRHYTLLTDIVYINNFQELCDIPIDILQPVHKFIKHMNIEITEEDDKRLMESVFKADNEYDNVLLNRFRIMI